MSQDFFVKKPVLINARRMLGSPMETHGVANWIAAYGYPWLVGDPSEPETLRVRNRPDEVPTKGIYINSSNGRLMIRTLEGDMEVGLGDWVIKGVEGEFYPCKHPIFLKTYRIATYEEVLKNG